MLVLYSSSSEVSVRWRATFGMLYYKGRQTRQARGDSVP